MCKAEDREGFSLLRVALRGRGVRMGWRTRRPAMRTGWRSVRDIIVAGRGIFQTVATEKLSRLIFVVFNWRFDGG